MSRPRASRLSRRIGFSPWSIGCAGAASACSTPPIALATSGASPTASWSCATGVGRRPGEAVRLCAAVRAMIGRDLDDGVRAAASSLIREVVLRMTGVRLHPGRGKLRSVRARGRGCGGDGSARRGAYLAFCVRHRNRVCRRRRRGRAGRDAMANEGSS